MPANRCQSGKPKAGYIPMILEAGSNGTAGITWVVDIQMMAGRSAGGRPSLGTLPRSARIVVSETFPAGRGRDRRRCIGRMIVGRCREFIIHSFSYYGGF